MCVSHFKVTDDVDEIKDDKKMSNGKDGVILVHREKIRVYYN